MYNETYAPILSVIERNFVRGDAAHGGGVALDAILGANIQDYTRTIERLRAMRVRVVHAGTIQASVKVALADAWLERHRQGGTSSC
jgi:hypothetical protein